MTPIRVTAGSLPTDVARLGAVATDEAFGMVDRLVDNYHDGSNCFDRAGEGLWVVQDTDQVVAVGGINIDPYFSDDALGRIRHVYVHPEYRRSGLGATLMRAIEDHGEQHFESFQLFTTNPDAARFYEALGYSPVRNQWKVSHRKTVE